jgi:hypothetical protein
MAEELKIENTTRRSAIKTAAQVAVTAPAVGLLLSASTKAASARIHYGDDGTFTYAPRDEGSDDGQVLTGRINSDDYYTF